MKTILGSMSARVTAVTFPAITVRNDFGALLRFFSSFFSHLFLAVIIFVPLPWVPTDSPSRGGDVMVYAFRHKLTELAHSL